MSQERGKKTHGDKHHHQSTDSEAGRGTESERGEASESTSEDRQGSGAANLDYDFRIVPVDPKNSFDFEDVADK